MKSRRDGRDREKKTTASPARTPVVRAMAAAAGVLRGRGAWVAGGVAAAVALGLAGAWLFTDEEKPGPPDPRARQYKEFDACLLTDEKGIAQGTLAASVWQGMQKASLETRARVSYVPVMGPQSVANVRPFFNSLIQRQCDVVVAVGAPQTQVTRADAGQHAKVRFVVVDGGSAEKAGKAEKTEKAKEAGNVTVAQPGEELEATVADVIRHAVRTSGM